MTLRHCVTDWSDSDSWSDLRTRRICDLASIWTRWTESPFATSSPSTRVLVPWSWPSLFGEADGSDFIDTPDGTIYSDWGAVVTANGWHLFNGTPRLIFPNGAFSTFAVDLRINACADALADFLVDWAPLSFLHGVHIDYLVNPVALGAASFSDFFSDVQFIDDFDAGIARFAARLRSRQPDWLLIGQLDQRASAAIEDPLNGYYLEQRIGQFAPQTSFATVQGWIEQHALDMAAAHPGREQAWIVEYRNPRSLATPPFGLTRDAYLAAHEDLCEATGAYLSYERDVRAHYAGHRPRTGYSRGTVTLRPAGPGNPNRNAFNDASGVLGASNFATMADQDLGTVARSLNSGDRDMYAIEPFAVAEAAGILDVSTILTGSGASSVARVWAKAGGAETYGNPHLILGTNEVFTDPNIPCPDGEDWTLAKVSDGTFDAGPEASFATALNPLLLGELEVEVAFEVEASTAEPAPLERITAVAPAGRVSIAAPVSRLPIQAQGMNRVSVEAPVARRAIGAPAGRIAIRLERPLTA